jgi:hypothetical protein
LNWIEEKLEIVFLSAVSQSSDEKVHVNKCIFERIVPKDGTYYIGIAIKLIRGIVC